MTRDELVTLVRDAMEAADVCCHAGSPRGISNVYDYIPTIDAAEIAVDALEGCETGLSRVHAIADVTQMIAVYGLDDDGSPVPVDEVELFARRKVESGAG